MNWLVLTIVLPLFIVPTNRQERELEELFIKENHFTYNGYTVTRSFAPWRENPFGDSRITIKRGSTRLAQIKGCCFRDSVRFTLLPLFGDGRKQLIVEAYSGGGHCCTSYYIYEIGPRFRVLFNGAAYSPDDVGYSMKLMDLNNDGRFEFVQSVMNFDYFYASHAKSVFPEVVFAFDHRYGKYRPANSSFSAYLLRDIATKRQAAEKLNADLNPAQASSDVWRRQEYHYRFLDITLTYIFAGREAEGWSFFEQNYKLPNKRELRADVKSMLKVSAVYRSLRKP